MGTSAPAVKARGAADESAGRVARRYDCPPATFGWSA